MQRRRGSSWVWWIYGAGTLLAGCDPQGRPDPGGAAGVWGDCDEAVVYTEACAGEGPAAEVAEICDPQLAVEILAAPCGGGGKEDEAGQGFWCDKLGLGCPDEVDDPDGPCVTDLEALLCEVPEEYAAACSAAPPGDLNEIAAYVAALEHEQVSGCALFPQDRDSQGLGGMCVGCRAEAEPCQFNVECGGELVCRPKDTEHRIYTRRANKRHPLDPLGQLSKGGLTCQPIGQFLFNGGDPAYTRVGDHCDTNLDCAGDLECRANFWGFLECVPAPTPQTCRWADDDQSVCADEYRFWAPNEMCE